MYGTLATWARQLELESDFQTLHRILEQERRADATLTRLAKTRINAEAPTEIPTNPPNSPSALEDARGHMKRATRPISHLIEDYPSAAMLLAGAAGYCLAYYTRAGVHAHIPRSELLETNERASVQPNASSGGIRRTIS